MLQKNVTARGQRNNTKAFASLPASLKTGLPKQDYLQSSMCPVDTNFDGFSSTKLKITDMALHVIIKKVFTIFLRNLSCQSLSVKISWLIFFCGFRNGNEKIAEIRASSLTASVLQIEPVIYN